MEQSKLVLYIAASLDGYIATEEHNLDWLFQVDGEGDNGYTEFYDTVDTVILGRITYDWIIQHGDGEFPYKDKECYVFSKTRKVDDSPAIFTAEDIVPFVEELKGKGGKNIWIVGGGDLLSSFIKEKLVDEIIVTVAPVLLGKGILLFRDNDSQTFLILKNVRQFNQFVELHYEVIA